MPILSGRAKRPLEPPKEGDLVIIQERYTDLTAITLKRDAHISNRYGRFPHNDLLESTLGTRWHATPPKDKANQTCAGFVHALAPTPELWSMAMHHRTQIVYPHDTAIVSMYLDLRPGCVLIECGTGSGSATTAFARVVAPHGHVHSYEFHEPRADAAREDMKKLALQDVVSVYGGIDISKDGFTGMADGVADAVFLDVPAPYLMGDEVRRVLKPDGVVCTFSPCVEQVNRTCDMFRETGFHSIRSVTAPMRTYETREMILHTPGFDELEQADDTKEMVNGVGNGEGHGEIGGDRKRRRVEDGVSEKMLRRAGRTAAAERLAVAALSGSHEGRVKRPAVRLHSKPFPSMKGHTSYLTFARRWREDGVVTGVQNGGGGENGESCAVS